jgi:drug/metabolite transporter (DMT)-like permease
MINPLSRKIAWPFLTAFTFAGSFIAGRYTVSELPPLTTACIRYLIALAVLSIMLFHYRAASLRVRSWTDWGKLALLGIFGVVGYQYFFFTGLYHTTTVNTSIINAFSPVVTGLGAAILIGERLRKANYIGIVIAVAGVIILICKANPSNFLGFRFNRGDLLMLMAVLSWAIYAIMIKTMLPVYSGFTLTYYAAFFGVIELALLCPLENPLGYLGKLSWATIISLGYLGVVATGGGHFLYNLCIGEIGPTRTASFVYSIVPILVSLLAYLFFGELLNYAMLLSMILIILGLRFMIVDKQ